MFNVKEVLSGTLRQLGIKRQYDAQSVILHWPEIVGGKIAAQAKPSAVRGNVLFVGVKAPAWAHHLSMLKEEILEKISAFTGQKHLTDIKFHAGNYQEPTNLEEEESEEHFGQAIRGVELPPVKRMEFMAIAHAVNNEVLRRRLERLLEKEWKRRELRKRQEWHACRKCHALCSQGEQYCTVCSIEAKEELRKKIRELLQDVPWLEYMEFTHYIPCNIFEFAYARQELIQRLVSQLDKDQPEQLKLNTLVMLLYRIQPEAITKEHLDKTLSFVRRNRYVLASGR